MSYSDLETKVIQWAEARRIIPNSTPAVQLLKGVSEMGELADATIKKDMAAVRDGVGDVLVCLIIYCALLDIDMTECLALAYDEIKGRKGTLTADGVFVKEVAGD